jgi:hypothetical protein
LELGRDERQPTDLAAEEAKRVLHDRRRAIVVRAHSENPRRTGILVGSNRAQVLGRHGNPEFGSTLPSRRLLEERND